jgi:hypothetical protein
MGKSVWENVWMGGEKTPTIHFFEAMETFFLGHSFRKENAGMNKS